MPAVQTAYATNIPVGKPGHVSDMTQSDQVSRTVEDVAGIAFGLAVKQGSADQGIVAWNGTGTILGITTRDRSVRQGELYSQYESARILRKGPIDVLVAATVAAGDLVYVTSTNTFTNVSTSNTQIPNARFETSAASGAVARIFIK